MKSNSARTPTKWNYITIFNHLSDFFGFDLPLEHRLGRIEIHNAIHESSTYRCPHN
jgi:hypothetical protein